MGRVVAEEAPVVEVDLDFAGHRIHSTRRAVGFTLHVDGEPIAVRPDEVLEVLPRRKVHGRLGALAEDPLVRALGTTVGDEYEVHLAGNVVQPGDVVAVCGAWDRAEARTRTLRASAIAIGAGARELLETWRARRRDTPGLVLPAVLAVLGGVALALGAIHDARAGAFGALGRAMPWLQGISLLAAGVFVWRRRRWMPELSRLGARREGSGKRWDSWGWLAAHAVLLAAALVPPRYLAADGLDEAWRLVPIAASGWILVYLAVLAAKDQRSAWRARRLLRAEPLGAGSAAGSLVAIEGALAGARITRVRTIEVTRSTEQVSYADDDGRIRTKDETSWSTSWTERSQAPAHGLVETAHGPVRVELSGATWASARRAITEGSGARTSGHHSMTSWSRTQADGTLRESTEAGDPMLAVGRATLDDRGYTLRAGRGEPVLLFSSPSGTSPREVLARAVWDHYLGVAALVVLGGLGLWIAVSPPHGEPLNVLARLLAELPT